MKAENTSDTCPIEAKIAVADQKVVKLEEQVEAIGQPAAQELQRRVDALKIELKALKRNFKESRNGTDAERMEKVQKLLRSIQHEESSVEHAAWFLSQGAPSSVIMAVEAGARMLRAINRKVVEETKPHAGSAFVNHSRQDLVDYYGLQDDDSKMAS